MSIGRPQRAAVLLVSLTAVFGVALASPAAAQALPPTTDPTQAAAGWLARQFTDGNHLVTDFGGVLYPDQGLTVDAVLALGAADVGQDVAAAAIGWLGEPANIVSYAGNGETDLYVGALAKLSLAAIAQGKDPASFGDDGVDLIARLLSTETETGRFSDISSYEPPPGETNDFSNGITQSLAIIALLRHDDATDVAAPVEFLASSQCADGGFPLLFEQDTCTSDVDTTSFAIQALLLADPDSEAAAAALGHLEDVQSDGGGFGGSAPTNEINSNSTGLAAQALRVGGRTAAAEAAVRFLLSLQAGCTAPAGQRGAIAYDETGFELGTAVRATAQALYGLAGVGFAEVTGTGDAAGAPALACAPESTAPTTATPSPTASQPPPQGSSGPGDLPATGVRPAAATGLGVLLILSGAGALLLSRLSRQRRMAGGGERP